jgi:hypothetical protein
MHRLLRLIVGALAIGSSVSSHALTTVAGATCTISFYAAVTDLTVLFDAAATFDSTFGGADLLGGPIPSGSISLGSYSLFADQVTATSATATLTVAGLASPGDGAFYIGDAGIDQVAASQLLAEPRAAMLLVSAAAALTLAHARPA